MRRAMLIGIVALLAVAVAAGVWLGRAQQPDAGEALDAASTQDEARAITLIGTRRPDFSLEDIDGRPRTASEWDGKVLALNFWATWCPPCLKEIPEFVALQDKYGGRGLQFLGIALEQPEAVREFAARHGMNYPSLTGGMDVIAVAESYGNRTGALPYTVIVDRDGAIVFTRAGPLRGAEAERLILPLL